ncbi:hypothetical protein C8R43DRAFT_951523 [Mycena crocata]|nr:hypothetical protein C8R43DRAFT_957676 [Mycena crocata]KAJ7150559.1 hypothetical protein C8R43DRAFT_951523 [Mycena crocata]
MSPHQEVIILSDSDEFESETPLVAVNKTARTSKRKRYIEILSSDDETQAPQQTSAYVSPIKQMKQEIRTLQERCSTLLEEIEGDINQAHRGREGPGSLYGKIVLDLSQVQDYINCELCVKTMWTPYMWVLPLTWGRNLLEAVHARPKYTCPMCRATVLTKPVQDYSLKAIIRAISANIGDSRSQQDTVAEQHQRKGKGKGKAVDSFDDFFGENM